MLGLLVVGLILIGYGVVSRPLSARGITSAMVLTLAGLLAGPAALGAVDVALEDALIERITEIALVLLLFSDAARIDLRSLRSQLAWPGRLLGIGLPLTMVAGAIVGLAVLPGVPIMSVVLLAIMLAPTDAALGQRVVTDPAVPSRLRQALNVESGLNDGLVVPFFLVAVDLAQAELAAGVGMSVVSQAAEQIGWGVVAGVGAAGLGAILLTTADRRGWVDGRWRQIVTLATAVLAYAAAGTLGGSGFIAAFVGGMVFGHLAGAHGLTWTLFTEEAGGVLAALVWIGFGALALGPILPELTWQVLLYAILSLTVVRMLPVAIAMVGTGARPPTVAFLGWFGPRGLASLVFGLLAFEAGVPGARTLFLVVTCTVATSILAHGLTSAPLVRAYRRWYDAVVVPRPDAREAVPATNPRVRGLPSPGEQPAPRD
jgi:NhaP-type Na+/H+ or K+/H+ antiporter